MLASECQQHIEGVEKQFGPRTPMVLKDVERRPAIEVVRGKIAIDKRPLRRIPDRIARVKALKVSPRHET
jgi:hypothetical protein